MNKILAFILGLATIFMVTACASVESDPTPDGTTSDPDMTENVYVVFPSDNFATFDIFGEIHNTILDASVKRFACADSSFWTPGLSREECLLRFQQSETAKLPVSELDKQLLSQGLEASRAYYNPQLVLQKLTGPSVCSEYIPTLPPVDGNLNDMLDYSLALGTIDHKEYLILDSLINIMKVCIANQLTSNEFAEAVDGLIDQWRYTYAYDDFSNHILYNKFIGDGRCLSLSADEIAYKSGVVSGIILSISRHSNHYWSESTVEYEGGETFWIIPALLDTGGAIIGCFIKTDPDSRGHTILSYAVCASSVGLISL